MSHVLALPNGTVLAADYRIERVLGAGGFGITYLADEMALQRLVTIKEYFPSDFAARSDKLEAVPKSANAQADYQWGLDRFIEEAQTLARFDHRNIVKVYRYFRAYRTGYMVLHFEEGQSLKTWMKTLGRAPRQSDLDPVVAPLLDALEVVHSADFLHRDIAPDNIILRKDGSPVLIDFGSARGEIAKHSRTLSALVKPGYSPYEQYSETGHRQGPWTDIYALGSTLYHLVSGRRPPDAPSRVVKDEYVPAAEVALSSFRSGFLRAIDRALVLEPERRPQSIKAWRGDLLAPDPREAKAGWRARREAAHAAGAPVVARSLAGALAEVVPPVPDAPGPHGGFLDFVDGLKRKDAPTPPAAAVTPPAAPTVVLPVPPAPASAEPAPSPPKAASMPPSAPKASARGALVPVPRVEPRKAARPRPVRTVSFRWRPLALKLGIGAVIAAVVVAYQDRLPFVERSASNVTTSSIKAASAAPAPAPDTMLVGQLKGHAGAVVAVAYTDDGRNIVSIGADATLRVWQSGGGLQRTISLDGGAATSVALSGRKAAVGHMDGAITLWDLDRAERIATLKRNEASIWAVAFAGGPRQLLASSHDWSVALWETGTTTAPLHVFEGHESAAQAVAYSPTGTWAVSGGADRSVRLWSTQNLSSIRTHRGHKDFVTTVAASPDGKLVASASLDGQVRVWSASSSRLFRILSGHKGRVGGIAFSPAGDLLASGGDDGAVRVWDFKRERGVLRTFGGGVPVRAVAFQPDGKRLAAAGDDGVVRLWSTDVAVLRRSSDD